MNGASAPDPELPSVGLGPARYVLVGALLLAAAAIAWHVGRLMDLREAAQGREGTPYDLSSLIVPREQVVIAAAPGAIPALVQPPTLTRAEAADATIGRSKLLVRGEPVIGVAVGEEACAYPLRLLDFHEVVLTVVGDVPVAVTWHPLSGVARVYSRRVGGSRLDLVPSGLLHNGCMVLADRRKPTSLYSQVLGRAIGGPAAERKEVLPELPFQLMRWEDWAAAHPETRVLAPIPKLIKIYKRAPYRSYRGSDDLRYPVTPLPPPGLRRKAPVLAVHAGGEWRVYAVSRIGEHAGTSGVWETEQGGVALTFRHWAGNRVDDPSLAVVSAPGGEPVRTIPSYWFAWYAHHPDAQLVE